MRVRSLFIAAVMALGTVAGLLAVGCSSGAKAADVEAARSRAIETAAADHADLSYRLQPGDELGIRFFYNEELNAQSKIRPDGMIALALLGEVRVAGQSVSELTSILRTRYEPYLREPEITVNVLEFGSQVAYVGGEVRRPGVVAISPRMTVLQGVIAAGGAMDTGDFKRIVIVRDQGTPEPLIMMVDVDRGIEKLALMPDLMLRPRDIVFVPKTGIARANQFVREYIRDLLPIQSSFNLQYQFTTIPSLP